MLGEDYADIVKKEQFTVLRELIYSGVDKRRQVCKQFIKAFGLQENEVSMLDVVQPAKNAYQKT